MTEGISSNLGAPVGLAAKTPLTPVSEDWDRSSIIKEPLAFRNKPVVNVTGKDNFKEPRKRKRGALPPKKQPSPSLPQAGAQTEEDGRVEGSSETKIKIKIRAKVEAGFESADNGGAIVDALAAGQKMPTDLEENELNCLSTLLISGKPLPVSIGFLFIEHLELFKGAAEMSYCYYLSIALCVGSIDGTGKLMGSLPTLLDLWLKTVSQATFVESAVIGGMILLEKLILSTDFEDTDTIMLVSKYIKGLKSKAASQRLSLAIVNTIVQVSQRSDYTRALIYESIVLESLEGEKMCCISWGSEKINWTSYLLLLDMNLFMSQQQLDCKVPEKVSLAPFSALDKVYSISTLSDSNGFVLLKSLAKDCSVLLHYPEWISAAFTLKQTLHFILKISVAKDLKPEMRSKTYEIGVIVAGSLRSLELIECESSKDTAEELLNFVAQAEFPSYIDGSKVASTIANIVGVPKLSSKREYHSGSDAYKSCLSWILKKPELGPHSDKFIALLLQSISDPGPQTRAKALRELTQVLVKDDPLLKKENFLLTIQRKIDDPSPSVREAAIEYLVYFSGENFTNSFFQIILTKICDPSIAVQKRAVKLLSDLLNGQISIEDSSEAKAALIGPASSEAKPSPQSAYSCLMDHWIIPTLNTRHAHAKRGDTVQLRHFMADFTAEIIRIIRCPRNKMKTFKAFLDKVLQDPIYGTPFKEACNNVVDLLFEALLTSIQEDSVSAVKFIVAALVNLIGERFSGLEKHFRLLCQLIAAEDSETVEHSLYLVKFSLQMGDRYLYRQVPSLAADLVKLIFRGSEAIVSLSLECLFKIAQASPRTLSQIAALYEKLYSFSIEQLECKATEQAPSLARSVYALGVITRLGCDSFPKWSIKPAKTAELIGRACLPDSVKAVRIFSCMSASELLICDPMLSLQEPLERVVREALTAEDNAVRLAVLKAFHNMITKDSLATQMPNFTQNNTSKFDYGSALCATLQNFAEKIIESASSTNPEVIESAALLLASMLRKGFSHPQIIVPALLSLWNCPWDQVCNRINDVCLEVLETQDSYVCMTFAQTILLSYQFAKFNQPSKVRGFLIDDNGEARSAFSFLYEGLKGKNRKQEFITALTRELEKAPSGVEYCQFLVEAASELSYKTIEELAFLVKKLTDLIALFDEDLAGDKDAIIEHIFIYRLKNFLAHNYRITSEQAEDAASNSRKEHACRRLSMTPLSLEGEEDLTRESLENLKLLIKNLENSAKDIDITRCKGLPKSKAKRPLAAARNKGKKKRSRAVNKKSRVVSEESASDDDEFM